jgi:hypothetical protein
VTPALVKTGPSSTNTRLSSTRARGSARRSSSRCAWCVVHSRPASSPARAARTLPAHTHSNCVGLALPRSHSITWRVALCCTSMAAPAMPVSTRMVPGASRGGNGSSPLKHRPAAVGALGSAPTKRRR